MMSSESPGTAPSAVRQSASFACSPSTFHDAERCPLKFVKDGSVAMPSLPWNVHGSAVHRLISVPPPDGDFEAAYDHYLGQLIAEAKRLGNSADSWLSVFTGIDDHGRPTLDIPEFAIRRAAGIALAKRLVRETVPQRTAAPQGLLGREVKVSAGSMNASIDLLAEEDGRLVVTDFKTGSIRDPRLHPPAIKPQYRSQLLIYAAMVQVTFGRCPARIRLIGSDGDRYEDDVNPAEAQDLLARCTALREEVQGLLSAGRASELARGFGSAACVTCSRRHCCPRTDERIRACGFVSHDADGSGLIDLEGQAVGVDRYQRRPWLDVRLSGEDCKVVRILKIGQSKPTRLHEQLSDGELIRVFGTRTRGGDGQPSTLPPACVEANTTTFLQLITDGTSAVRAAP